VAGEDAVARDGLELVRGRRVHVEPGHRDRRPEQVDRAHRRRMADDPGLAPCTQNFTSDVAGGSTVNPTITWFARSESTNRTLIVGPSGSWRIGGDTSEKLRRQPVRARWQRGVDEADVEHREDVNPPTLPPPTGGFAA
jgi:hypothetical protein